MRSNNIRLDRNEPESAVPDTAAPPPSESADRVARTISALRNSHEHMRGVFRHGGCYEMYRIIRAIEPGARAWHIDGHVYTEVDDRLYDIDGEWRPQPDQRKRLEPLFRNGRRPWLWRNKAAERRRGFQERRLAAFRITWWLSAELALSRLKVRAAALVLPGRLRREIFAAIKLRAEAEAIQVYESGTERAAKHLAQRRRTDAVSSNAASRRRKKR